jgi:hypothetical protein
VKLIKHPDPDGTFSLLDGKGGVVARGLGEGDADAQIGSEASPDTPVAGKPGKPEAGKAGPDHAGEVKPDKSKAGDQQASPRERKNSPLCCPGESTDLERPRYRPLVP